MSLPHKLHSLLASLANEVSRATAGSTEAQFPILDLLANIRDEAKQATEWGQLQHSANEAWERLVRIIEAGQNFTDEHIVWLQEIRQSLSTPYSSGVPARTDISQGLAVAPAEPANVDDSVPSVLDDESIVLNIAEDLDLLREFTNESREHLNNIEQGVLVLERYPTDAGTLNTIFRAFHTLKGSAGFLNLGPINRLAHVLETLLDLVRQQKLSAEKGIIELILRGRDVLKQFLDAIEPQVSGSQSMAPIRIETAPLKGELKRVIAEASEVPDGLLEPRPPASGVPIAEPDPACTSESNPESSTGPTPTLGNARLALPIVAPARPSDSPLPERSASQSAVVRVDTAKLDSLLDLIGEMVVSQSLVSQTLNRLAEQDSQFARNVAHLSRTTRDLQRVGMSMRMVPVRGVFQKMARVVRDIGTKQNKSVQLVTTGEDTELDRGVVEELNDPLLHLIRNSVDHGIESEEVRAKAGKAATGTIHLRAFHQGGNIIIEIEDDGAGLNREKILAKALDRGLITSAANLSNEEIFSCIFAAGFSTAEKVTDISGRGVGLDVVRRNIEHLRGCVDVFSDPGHGSRFKITLPLTLAIIDGLVVRVGAERYVIPTLSVRESFRPRPEMITRVQNRAEVVDVRGRLIPLLRLYEYFEIRPCSTTPSEGIVIVAQSGANFRCLLVDSLESKQEVVIKNLNDILIHKNRSLAGAAILGDGRVGLILDVNLLVQQEPQGFAHAA